MSGESEFLTALRQVRKMLAKAHHDLNREGLVRWTMGNISVRFGDSVIIKPSGIRYSNLSGGNMVWTDLFGKPRELQKLNPSTDVFAHCAIYRGWKGHAAEINAIVHTHSTYATAFAAAGKSIPCILTSIADEFGTEVPCARFATIGGDDIGTAVLETLNKRFCSAVLLKSHGVFTFGSTIEGALKAAVMVEDAAQTAYHALMLAGSMWRAVGDAIPLIPQEEIDACYERYHTAYGQGDPKIAERRNDRGEEYDEGDPL